MIELPSWVTDALVDGGNYVLRAQTDNGECSFQVNAASFEGDLEYRRTAFSILADIVFETLYPGEWSAANKRWETSSCPMTEREKFLLSERRRLLANWSH